MRVLDEKQEQKEASKDRLEAWREKVKSEATKTCQEAEERLGWYMAPEINDRWE